MTQTPDNMAFPLTYEVADLPAALNLGLAKVKDFLASGALVSRKVGRRTLVLRADVDAFLEALPVAVPTFKSKIEGSPLDKIVDAHMRAEIEALSIRPRLAVGNTEADKIAQAYEVIGVLLARCGDFDTPEGKRALDYFAGSTVAPDFLPWPAPPLN